MNNIFINCKYRDRIIIPTLALSPSAEFMSLNDKDKMGSLALMKDGVLAKVKRCETKSAFDIEEEIKELYQMSAWDYLCKWNKACEDQLSSLWLWDIYLEKA